MKKTDLYIKKRAGHKTLMKRNWKKKKDETEKITYEERSDEKGKKERPRSRSVKKRFPAIGRWYDLIGRLVLIKSLANSPNGVLLVAPSLQ